MSRRQSLISRLGIASLIGLISSTLLGLPIGGGMAAAATSYTAFTIEGEPGTHVGGGLPQVYTPPDATFETSDPYRTTSKEWVFLVIRGVSGTAEGHWWYVNLAAPPGQELAVGTYTGATRAAFRAPGEPGIDIYGDGAGCDPHGEFVIQEIAFTGDTLTSLSASYSFTCDNHSTRTAGEVRYASSLGFAGLRQLPNTGYSHLSFGNVILGQSSAPQSTEIVNAGTTSITITGLGSFGDHTADFPLTGNTCGGTTLAPGSSCFLETTFTPTASGYRQATATYTTDTHGYVHGIKLVGSGVPAVPGLDIQPGEGLAFGGVTLGLTSAVKSFTLRSTGNVPVTLGARTVIGDHASDFAVTSDDCPTGDFMPGASCMISVRFAPAAEGARTAALRLVSDLAWSPMDMPLTGAGVRPSSGISWSTTYRAGPAYTWNFGGALGRTVQSGAQRLHLVYATDRVSGTWAKDTGPYAGIYYVRASSGATWSTPKRLNPSTQHAARTALAAAGSRVYVAWVSQTRWVRYSATAPRILYVRVNTNHGDAAAWRSPIRLTSTTGRIDYPSVTASGNDVHVTWTDGVTGAIRVATSRDRGVTWKTRTIGSTSLATASGRIGLPSIAASSATVAVSWTADAFGTVKTRTSADNGTTWGTTATTGTQSLGFTSTAVRGSRIAVAFTTADDVVVRQRIGGTWGAAMVVAALPPNASSQPYAPLVLLQDSTRIAVSWSEEIEGDFFWSHLKWAESPNNGAMWHVTQTLAAASSSSARRTNDWASAVWPSASKRYVAWNGWTYGTLHYRQYVRIGTGAPVATLAATVWQPNPITGSPKPTVRITDALDTRADRR